MDALARSIFCVTFILFIFVTGCAYGEDKDKADEAPMTVRMLEDKLDEISKEREKVKSQIEELTSVQAMIEQEIRTLDSLKPDTDSAREAITEIKGAIDQLNQLPPDTAIDENHPSASQYRSAFEDFDIATTRLLERSANRFFQYFEAVLKRETATDRMVGGLVETTTEEWRESSEPTYIYSLPYGTFKRSTADKKLQLADERVKALQTDDQILKHFEEQKGKRKEILNRLAQSLAAKTTNLMTKLTQLDKDYTSTSFLLEKKLGQQTAVDVKLVYGIYLMIPTLLLMFLSLRVFPLDIARELIDKRSLVEVISMAFMLITIIILGTGGKINTETLGTLLGTIAGYVFGRIGATQSPRT